MRNVCYLIAIAAILLTTLVGTLLVAGFGYLASKSTEMNKDGSAYATSAATAITSNWNADALLSRAGPDLMKATDAAHVRLIFDRFRPLGELVKLPACTGTTTVSVDLFAKLTVRSLFVCAATYQRNTATIKIYMTNVDQHWMINGFRVDTPPAVVPMVRKI